MAAPEDGGHELWPTVHVQGHEAWDFTQAASNVHRCAYIHTYKQTDRQTYMHINKQKKYIHIRAAVF